jgi:hypothetical protein
VKGGEDSALWSEIGRYAGVLSVAVALYTLGVALASLDQLLAWLDTLFSTILSVFSALVIGLTLFRYQTRETDRKKREDLALYLRRNWVTSAGVFRHRGLPCPRKSWMTRSLPTFTRYA